MICKMCGNWIPPEFDSCYVCGDYRIYFFIHKLLNKINARHTEEEDKPYQTNDMKFVEESGI